MSEIASQVIPAREGGVFGLRICVAVVAFLGLAMIWVCVDNFPQILQEWVTPDPKHWVVPFGPHPGFLLTLEALCILIAVGLVWVTPTTPAAGWLALTLALVATGYAGLHFLPLEPQVTDPLLSRSLRWWASVTTAGSVPREIGIWLFRSNFTALAFLPWLGAWAFAGSTQLIFLRTFVSRAAGAQTPRVSGNDLAMVLASGMLLAAITHWSIDSLAVWIRAVCALLAAAGFGFWLLHRRAKREGARLCLAFSIPLLAHSLLVFIPELHVAVAAVCLLIVSLRFERIHSFFLFLPPLVLAVAFFVSWTTSPTEVIVGVHVWNACALLACFLYVSRRIRHLRTEGRGQALVLLTGFVVAGLFGLLYAVTLFAKGNCQIVSLTAICWMYRHLDWWLILPLLSLSVFSIFALFFRGQIDASVLFRRATVYATLTVLAIFTFGVLETTASQLLSVGFPRGTPPAIAAGVIALAIHPVKKRCDSYVERLLVFLLRP